MHGRKKISLASKSIMQQIHSRDVVMPIRCTTIINRPKNLKLITVINNSGLIDISSIVYPMRKCVRESMTLKDKSLNARYNPDQWV